MIPSFRGRASRSIPIGVSFDPLAASLVVYRLFLFYPVSIMYDCFSFEHEVLISFTKGEIEGEGNP